MAELFQMPLADTDSMIEEKEGIRISEIFAVQGESYFRDLETEFLKSLLEETKNIEMKNSERMVGGAFDENKKYIISVGGGLPVREENQKLLKQLGLVIYLKAKPETIYERLKGDTTRPLLQTENPLQKIKDMLVEREEKYQAAAHEVINVDGKSIDKIIQEIANFQK